MRALIYVDPRHDDAGSTIQLIHDFNSTSKSLPEDDKETGIYGSKNHAQTIMEHPKIADLFYAFLMCMQKLILGLYTPWNSMARSVSWRSYNHSGKARDQEQDGSMVGATTIPPTSTLLLDKPKPCKIFALDSNTRKVSIWTEVERIGKVTTRPPWPALDGLEYLRGQIFGTVTDSGTLVKTQVDATRKYKSGSLEVLVV
ncbi:hypothetical protein EAE96_002741 [Botrytis aclada]|nr:hypothetical protein EAE96_002741 [Botrytis aclada]